MPCGCRAQRIALVASDRAYLLTLGSAASTSTPEGGRGQCRGGTSVIGRGRLDEAQSHRWIRTISWTINVEHARNIIERLISHLKKKKFDDANAD